ncbi:MAG TPA: GNAT family N-acetyltransferase [Abditibacterium sp.]|jgi:ribosomal protein S18 acetylase RimI-like enzyme
MVFPLESENLVECVHLFLGVFNQEPWNEKWAKSSVIRRFEDCQRTPGFYGLCWQEDSRIEAFAFGYFEQWDESQHFYLKEMCVATQKQRCGIGTKLLDVLTEKLRENGVTKLFLHTARDSIAQDFYLRCGFYISPKMIMMAKHL